MKKSNARLLALVDHLSHWQRVEAAIDEMGMQLKKNARMHNVIALEDVHHLELSTKTVHELAKDKPDMKKVLAWTQEEIDGRAQYDPAYPEHHERKFEDMSMFELMEYLADWHVVVEKAALDPGEAFDETAENLHIPEHIVRLMRNTLEDMGWM